MTEQVRAIRLRPTLSTVLNSATNSDGEIFFDSDNQTLRIFDNGASALIATRSWTTNSIGTAIAAIPASIITNDDINWVPYDQLIDLPSAADNHGMFAHVHGTGKAYYAHAGNWIELANASDVVGASVALTDLSVGAAASASGVGAIAYNNSTGVFTYTPPLLSTYATTASLAAVATSGAYADLTGKPSIPVATLPAITKLTVTANGSSAYRFDQYGTTDDPTIYAISATTIAFDLTGATGHPFLIQTSGGANYDTGLVHIDTDGTTTTGAAAQSKSSGTLYWKIPIGTTGNYQYKCQIHGSMLGVITIKDFATL